MSDHAQINLVCFYRVVSIYMTILCCSKSCGDVILYSLTFFFSPPFLLFEIQIDPDLPDSRNDDTGE